MPIRPLSAGFRKGFAVFSSAFPHAGSPYWRNLPLRRMITPILSTLFILSAIGFAVNLTMLDRAPLGKGFLWPALIGGGGAGILVARTKKIRWVPVLMVLEGFAMWWASTTYLAPTPIPRDVKERAVANAVAMMACTAIGYRLMVFFLSGEGLANVRLETELSLAQGIQRVLVPEVRFQNSQLQAYGVSLPSEKVGGDLVDVVDNCGTFAYVADVSGHGLPAGQLMGMLKAAVRLGLEVGCEPAKLLDHINSVLPGVKEPHMYATVAGILFGASPYAECVLAGHPPIFQYRKLSDDAIRFSMEQFPVGMLPNTSYHGQRVLCSSGDVFLIVTDGIVEMTDQNECEFGLERIQSLLIANAHRPLAEVSSAIMEQVRLHGPQSDDQTLLLVRIR